jgi:hypothetical protein
VSSNSEGNSPAYPWGEHGTQLGGLTKRELFAAMVMQGFVSADDYQHVMLGSGYQLADYATASVRIADALLAELAKDGAA